MQWTIGAVLPAIDGQQQSLGFAGPVTGVHHEVLFVAGGANFPDGMPWMGGKKKYYDEVYALKKDEKGALKYFKSFRLPEAIAYAAVCSTPQGILYAGGENDQGISNKVWLLQWNASAEKMTVQNLPDLPLAVTNAAIACQENKVYLAGGETKDAASDHFYELDLNDTAAGWQPLPALPRPFSNTVMVMQSNNCIYVIGGRKKTASGISDLYASVYAFDLKNKKWQEKKPLPYPLSAGTGIAKGDNTILLFGGDKGVVFHQTETLIAAINKEKDEAKKQALIQQKAELQSAHPGFSSDVLEYNTIKDEWKKIDTIPFPGQVTTSAVKWDDEILIPSGEIKAGVRTPNILTGKLFRK